ncbi:MAG: flavocytochrome C [Betaproteobacteria bacterium]|nr:flavocytochrome C [Betaproteobacteria bacterium]NBT74833.1 flavocytochrome C [Betaproteobacteria bacterium]NBY13608.1 flavocytochrome C [Betaproteobacteria bacterium]NCA16319.1 flavocytochrome C [Betaproteobacteria bacterium]NDF03615.1 flavocytochrome C [Betaproteobacteria bacterium]
MKNSFHSRRQVLKGGAAAAALGGASLLAGCATPSTSSQQASVPTQKIGRVVIVGGGFGGATAAKYISMWGQGAIEVVLIERERSFYSCPISNLVLSGTQKIDYVQRDYEGLKNRGILVINDEVTSIDPVKQTVSLRKVADLRYDRLVVSPGVEFLFDQIAGLNAEAQKTTLHAWKAGAQTVALRAQLEAMPNGGTYILSIPKAPYRCPPGPYERACQVAAYFKREKPKSKVLLLDANPDVQSKKGLFMKVWKEKYDGILTYTPNMSVTEVDAKTKTLATEVGEKIKGDVLNIVPPQRAGEIAKAGGLINMNNLWCGVDWVTMESTAVPRVHVLGDATFAAPGMPKSGHMANQHGKVCAAAIVELMNGRTPLPLTMSNTCYSFTTETEVVHVASVHRFDPEKKTMVMVEGAGGLSKEPTELEGSYAYAWAQNIWADMLT